jgi:cytochrome c553
LFVSLETSGEVAVLDAHSRRELARIQVGRAPQSLLVSADRRTLYVHNFMDRSVGVFDLAPMIERGLGEVPAVVTLPTVGNERLSAQILRGKQLFYDARDPRLARDRYMSCASCHNDGGHDGRVWDLTGQGEGLRNTVSLRGRGGGQGHLHWSNNFDEVQDFEGQIRALAGGTGLMTDSQFTSGTRSQPLGDRKAGVSADLDALAAYVASLDKADPSPWRSSSGGLTALASEGKTVFAALACSSCHAGVAYTISAANNPEDIGTLTPASGQRLGGALTGIDVPTLRDVWATAPYLHDGSAPTLEAAVKAHGFVSVGDADLDRLTAYLRQIGREEAAAPDFQGTGLAGTYFKGTSLAGAPLLKRTEAVNFDWGKGSPASGVPSDKFSARWEGYVVIPTTGDYRFRTVSSDGVRLWIGTERVINRWDNHTEKTDTSQSIRFVAGQRVPVKLEYFENTGSAVIQLRWLTPNFSTYAAVPASSLTPK